MAKEGNGSFEILAEMRALAQKSAELAKQAFDSFISAAQHAVNTAENQATSAHSGMKQVGELAVNFTKRNIDTSFDFAENLVRAKDAQELMALHTDCVFRAHRSGQRIEQAGRQAGWPGQSGRLALIAPPGLGIDLQFGAGTMIL